MFWEKKVLITRINSSIFCAGVHFLTGSTINLWYNPSNAKKPLKQTEVTKRASLGRDKKPQKSGYKILPSIKSFLCPPPVSATICSAPPSLVLASLCRQRGTVTRVYLPL